MTQNFSNIFFYSQRSPVSSCTGVQEYVFPSLSDEEVVAPPALEEVPATIETVEQPVQEIPLHSMPNLPYQLHKLHMILDQQAHL